MIARDRRGVSDALSFVLIFGILLLSVGAVYVVGFETLTSYQEGDQVANAERALVGLTGAFDDVERGNANARTGEIRLAGGQLSIGESGSLAVSVGYDDEGGGDGVWVRNVSTGSLAYGFSDETIAYESGAVVRRTADGGVLRRPPTMLCSADRAIVSVVTIKQRGDAETISGDGSVEVEIERVANTFRYPMTENGTTINEADAATFVNVSVDDTAYADEWEQWFDEQDEWTATADGYECDTDAVFVRETRVTVRLFD